MTYTRNANLSEPNHRKLIWLARARKAEDNTLEPRKGYDYLLNEILDAFFEKNYPQLQDFITKREELDAKAVEALSQPKEP